MYVCGYCGLEYATPAERAKCELACEAKQVREAEKENRLKLIQEKQQRLQEIRAARDELARLQDEYRKDYGPNFDDLFYAEFPMLFFGGPRE